MLATEKGLTADAALLEPAERTAVEQALADLRQAIANAASASLIQGRIDALDEATHEWAGRRMNRAIAAAMAGKALDAVEHAAGVEAHLEAHAAGRS